MTDMKQINADVEAMQGRIANTFATLRDAKENRTGAHISPDGMRAILQYVDWLELDLATTKARAAQAEADAQQANDCAKQFAQGLVDYNKHGDMCAAYSIWIKRGPCDCGYDAAKKYMEAK